MKNLYIMGVDSVRGYQHRLLERIDAEEHFNTCVCTVKDHGESEDYSDPRYTIVDYDVCEHNKYREVYDFNDLLPLSKEVLEKMRPYESTALQLLMRNHEQYIYTYDEAKALYLDHLRFWNDIFVKKQLTHVIQPDMPHHCHDYIIYVLASVYQCKRYVLVPNSIMNRLLITTDFEQSNEKLLEDYEALRKQTDDFVLAEDVETYYQALLVTNKIADTKFLSLNKSKAELTKYRLGMYRSYFTAQNVLKRIKPLLKKRAKAIFHGDHEESRRYKYLIRKEKDMKRRERIRQHQMVPPKYCSRYAQKVDLNEPFILFLLHYQPEATTLPQAGVFVEQELIVALLADAAQKRGLKLYIKDHYVQPYRRKEFYDTLIHTPNVLFVDSEIDSKELFTRCVVSATCNGTVIQESIFNGKAVLAFGNGAFNDAPGVYKCSCREDTEFALDEILNNQYHIDQHDVRAYLKALEMNSVRTNRYISDETTKNNITDEESMENLARFVIEKLREQ